ncbi:putative bifunctional diguanylate cyclase/phosphodiesterase [Modestobacter sp. VKM Ac-2985]|uniref:putative bifunctional diguanylate cyclase/phosphodiesterase n=1 Tax=Modestobacter sp. VKM Ac-2985 TaxID=3004139 RepID=UPI0022AB8F3C|nr:bifunctional diguanylate cyclase/phosphodiesterase [Modestobacter sp. VKM Ac-2985]MCZ2838384.1 bifunctional diguanylate cyclase/phosphodiesterase [Modestobacter sp. VKM Ac-2985]
MVSRTADDGGRTAAAVWLSLAAALVVLVGLTGGSTSASIVYLVVTVGAAVAAWLGVRRCRPGPAARWVAVAVSLNAVGDVLWQLQAWLADAPPDVSVADAAYLASYVALGAALLVYAGDGDSHPRARFHALLDGAAVLVIALLVVWQTSVHSTLTDDSLPLGTRAIWAAYPLLDAMVLGLVVRGMVVQSRVGVPALLLGLGSTAWLASDLAWLLLAAPDTVSGWLDAGWLVGAIALATLPWADRSALPAGPTVTTATAGTGRWRMTLAFLPLLVPGGFELRAWLAGADIDPLPGLLATATLTVLIIVRAQRLLTDQDRARAEVRSLARRYEALAVTSSDAVAVVDRDGRLTSDSRSLAALLGRPGCTGRSLPQLLSGIGVDPTDVLGALDRARLTPGEPVELELRGTHPTGGTVWLGGRAVDLRHDPDVGGIAVSVYDITPRKLAEQELAHQAFHDGLTGLANRSLFLDHTEQALRRAGRTGSPPIVLCLDLDGFKDVNDSLGHLAGDDLLRTVAERLQGVVRAADTVARLGGDEFAVLIDDTRDGLPVAASLAERLLQVLGEPVLLHGHRVTVAASIGIVVAEPDATPLSLFRDADIAMYQAKAAGRAQWVVFDPSMRAAALERIELERELGGALAAGQLRLVYQPVVDLQTEQVVGFEALLRWQHPSLGAIGPDRFVPIAEDSGHILPIGRWVLAEATATAARWQRAHPRLTPLSMAVNVSARQLAGGTLVEHVAEALTSSGITPSSLVLEVTETALVTDPDAVAARLCELRALGTRLALDDFGTGYSSLSYLRQFDVDVLKIDRSFVSLLDGSADDAAIVHGLVQLGHTLRLEVVAEGVETEAQRDRLRAERCDLAQGWLFAKPLEAEEAELLLLAQAAGAPALPRPRPATTAGDLPVAQA